MIEIVSGAEQDTGPIRNVAVIGAGRRGRAFALRCVRAGCAVVLEDVLSSNLRKAAEELQARGDEMALAQIRLAGSVEDAVREADVAVDFVPDELESKLEIVSLMDRMAPPKTIFCTPTALSITDLASCTYRPGSCVALVGADDEFEGAVDLVRGEGTTPETIARVSEWMERLGVAVRVIADERAPALVRRDQA